MFRRNESLPDLAKLMDDLAEIDGCWLESKSARDETAQITRR